MAENQPYAMKLEKRVIPSSENAITSPVLCGDWEEAHTYLVMKLIFSPELEFSVVRKMSGSTGAATIAFVACSPSRSRTRLVKYP